MRLYLGLVARWRLLAFASGEPAKVTGSIMRILMLTPFVPASTAVNAGVLVMYWRVASLAARHRITLVTFRRPGDSEAIASLETQGVEVYAVDWRQPSDWRRWLRRSRLATAWLRGRRPLRVLEFSDHRMQLLVDRLLARQPFDVMHVESAFMAPVAGYRFPHRIPSLLIEHEVALVPASENRVRSGNIVKHALYRAEWRRWRRYELTTWPRFQRIQAVTPQDAQVIRRGAPAVADRVRVNPVGIDLPTLPSQRHEDPNTVVFVGSFAHQPNVDAALWLGNDIMPVLRTVHKGVRLFIVGADPPAGVRGLACEDTDVTGRVPCVEPYLERAAVVVAPIRTGGGMRIKVLQAMAHGKAVVTTPLGAEGLAVEGIEPSLLMSQTSEGLAHSIGHLLADEDKRLELGRRARQFVAAHHAWSAHMQRLEQTYDEIAPAGSPAGVYPFR
ncbi:MAG: glycosyltransferase [Chloroflexota bacterium]